MQAPEPDELLMAQVAAGRGESLTPLVQRYTVPLVSFLHRMTGDRDRAEDLFQESFLNVWRKRRTYTFPRPFKPWLYAIAVNVARAAYRSAKEMVALPAGVSPMSKEPSPHEDAIGAESSAKIAAAIRNLPEAQRAVLAMRVWDGMSYGQIAEAIGRTEATVRSHMSHGLATLRAAMGGMS